jgi:hypothetical protein
MRALYEGLNSALVVSGKGAASGPDAAYLARLWLHEGLRLLHDRLMTSPERAWCMDTLEGIARKYFGPLVC